MLPIGAAVSEVIFFGQDEVEKEDGEVARGVLGCVKGLWRKLGPRGRGVVKRTLAVVVAQVGGAMGSAGTVKGGNLYGALGLGAVWTVATVIVGGVLGWVGNV